MKTLTPYVNAAGLNACPPIVLKMNLENELKLLNRHKKLIQNE